MIKSNILIVMPSSKIGGAEQVLLQIANFYHNSNVEIFYFKINNKSDLNYLPKKFNIIYNKYGNNFFLGLLYFIYHKIIFENKYDLVFSSHVHINSILGLFRKYKILNTKYLICRESTYIFKRFFGIKKYIYLIIYDLGYKYLDILIVQSLGMKTSIEVNLNYNIINYDKILILNNPTSFIINIEKSTKNILLHKPYFVAAGRFIYEKGFDILIDSFSLFLKSYPYFKLYILGEGKLFNDIYEKVKNLNILNSVFLIGFTDDVYYYFKHAKTCVISSRIEGFPNVLLQMMTVNSNIVSTICTDKIIDIPGIIKCHPNSVDSLYHSLIKSIQSDNDNSFIFSNYLKENSINNFIEKIYLKLEHK